jgi:hypothetical protein
VYADHDERLICVLALKPPQIIEIPDAINARKGKEIEQHHLPPELRHANR